MNLKNGISRGIRVAALLALLFVGSAATAADPNPDPSWLDIIQNWFETLLDDEPETVEEDGGVFHVPGG